MNKNRRIKVDENYSPLPTYKGDEIYVNGIFNFSISRILEHIDLGKLEVEKEKINVKEWFRLHFRGLVNEEHLSMVDISKPILQAEIRPGMLEIIDGNHRMERAYCGGIEFVESYKLKGEQLLPYFADIRGYKAFVQYWNLKL
ncbi:hypothetical protein [Clostridium isatidis]|uniref:hypothetical protein n=1 Tax=Clostridium isatidis TaxID=182773 RepID=UPI003AAAC3D8